jgi:hypothetical protein
MFTQASSQGGDTYTTQLPTLVNWLPANATQHSHHKPCSKGNNHYYYCTTQSFFPQLKTLLVQEFIRSYHTSGSHHCGSSSSAARPRHGRHGIQSNQSEPTHAFNLEQIHTLNIQEQMETLYNRTIIISTLVDSHPPERLLPHFWMLPMAFATSPLAPPPSLHAIHLLLCAFNLKNKQDFHYCIMHHKHQKIKTI